MTVVLAINGDRISPVLDVTRCFLLVTARPDGALMRKEEIIDDDEPVSKVRRIVDLGARVLICGAISWPLEAVLTSAGVRVVPNTCGLLDEVIAAFFSGDLTGRAFLMPGCPGRQYRQRHRRRNRWPKEWH